MKSRYDYMEEGVVCDSEDGIPYPDCLTTNYSDFTITAIPTTHRVTASDISKFWLYMYKLYKRADMDDVLLNMNGIGYIGELQPGSLIFNFSMNDINNFNFNKRKEVEQ